MKKCKTCNVEKEFIEFTKDKSKKDLLDNNCKNCKKKYIKKYRLENNQKIKQYRKSNKEKIKQYNKKYFKDNRDYYRQYKKKWQKQKRITDTLFKLCHNLRNRTCMAFKRKGYTKKTKTQEMLGVDWEVCKLNIERQFTKGMSWNNYGDWHIDHIIPLASANTEEELKKLCHYSNLQPLWAFDNLIKSAKINGQQNKFRF